MICEEKAEEYLKNKILEHNRDFSLRPKNAITYLDELKQTYLDSYEEGYEDCRHYAHDYYKPKWHDLRKNPDDLPKDDRECLCFTVGCYFVGYYDEEWHFDEFYSDKIDAWCELPKFEE